MTSVLLHRFPILIVEKHLDTFGHVNNATYLNLFEEARWDWITARDFGLDRIQASRTGPVVLEVNVRFKRELHCRERATIETKLLEHNGKIVRLGQNIYRGDATLACEAVFSMGFFDLDRRKLISPSPEWERVLTTPLI
jgi:YbgC/YbaW family acyl-CoA thioester hydrolase